MIYYYLESGLIVTKESDFNNPQPRFHTKTRTMMNPVQSELNINTREYCVINGELTKREPLPYTLPKDVIAVNEILPITVPVGTKYIIESSVARVVGECESTTLEFSTEIAGDYLVILEKLPFQLTYLKVTVNE